MRWPKVKISSSRMTFFRSMPTVLRNLDLGKK